MTTVNYVCDWSTSVRVSTLPLCRSSEASSQPLPCPGISRELCRRSQSCLHHSSRRRASPHALSAQTTSQGTTWHTDWLPRTQTHTHIHARSNKVWLPNYLTAIRRYTSHGWAESKWRRTTQKRREVVSSTGPEWMLSVSRADCQGEETRKCWKEREREREVCSLWVRKSQLSLPDKVLHCLIVVIQCNYNTEHTHQTHTQAWRWGRSERWLCASYGLQSVCAVCLQQTHSSNMVIGIPGIPSSWITVAI